MTTTTERYTSEQMRAKAEALLKSNTAEILASDMLWMAAKHFEYTATRLQSLEAENARLRKAFADLRDADDMSETVRAIARNALKED